MFSQPDLTLIQKKIGLTLTETKATLSSVELELSGCGSKASRVEPDCGSFYSCC